MSAAADANSGAAGLGRRALHADAHVLVVGDAMLDRYHEGAATRISPEAPVPVLRVAQTYDRPGGSANVALNIAMLGAEGDVARLRRR